ncbi:uncharacterized protein LOC121415159 isoform X2 [Lytechinus variegatus]|uniref:uncharacterized protein LOC121415159 isoform X2 n=1 Tax=Lytechinus variegatus TaxID=7654 RepID=UPI001BB11D6F|nr:uncharacterized protein LOC121415159 isoform X2 [Lytechinus variegatus]
MNRIAVIGKRESATKQDQPPRNDVKVNPLWNEMLEPLLFALKVVGVFHETTFKGALKTRDQTEGSGWFPDADPEPPRSRSWRNGLSRVYHAFVCIYLWLNAIRMTYVISLSVRYDLITLQVYFYVVSICNTIMFAVCYREKRMPLFQRHWNSSVTFLNTRRTKCSFDGKILKTKAENLNGNPKRYTKSAVFVTITCICMTLFNFATMTFLTFGFGGLNPLSSSGICGPWLTELFCGINLIFALYATAAYIFPGALYSLICHNISLKFDNLSEEFDQVLSSSHPIDKKTLNCFRRRHAIICHTVEVADDVFSPLVGVNYSTNIPLIIFLLYQLFYIAGGDLIYTGLTLFWLLSCSTSVLLLSLFTVRVHDKAHSLRRRVHDLQMDTFDSDLSQVQLLFLARLDGPEIGMTALGCFVITKERVLAVVSTLITYFTILLQFQQTTPTTDITMATTNMTTNIPSVSHTSPEP